MLRRGSCERNTKAQTLVPVRWKSEIAVRSSRSRCAMAVRSKKGNFMSEKKFNASEQPYDPSDDPDSDPENVQSVTHQADQAEGEDEGEVYS